MVETRDPDPRNLGDCPELNDASQIEVDEGEMRNMALIKRFIAEDSGAETVEYALVLALMALAAAVGITTAGQSLQSWWNTLSGTISGLSAS